jgi:ABC-type nitrate/sulfonate/bicarbonate transport system permease component
MGYAISLLLGVLSGLAVSRARILNDTVGSLILGPNLAQHLLAPLGITVVWIERAGNLSLSWLRVPHFTIATEAGIKNAPPLMP